MSQFDDFETTENVYYLLGRGMKGPKLIITHYVQVRRSAEQRDPEQAKQEALNQAEQQGNASLPKDCREIGRHVLFTMEKDAVLARIYIEVLENIAVEAPVREGIAE